LNLPWDSNKALEVFNKLDESMNKPELLNALTPYLIDDYFYFSKPLAIAKLQDGLL